MNRLQNAMLITWLLALLLFAAFNWALVDQVFDIEFLFMPFQIRLLLWLMLLGFAVPLAIRLITQFGIRANYRRAEREIGAIKTKAFDGLSGEFEKLGSKLQDKVVERIQTIMAEQAARGGGAGDSPGEGGGADQPSGEKEPAEAGDKENAGESESESDKP